ncbi:MAG: plasmid mobilization relaxosome protein MobC, partial [Alphaproteobacteria bacterium]
SFRLTAADHAAYLAKVEASGLKPSVFFRDAVVQNKTQIVARVKSSPERGRLVYLMNKASNNINQLAHRANADNLAGVTSEATCARLLYELEKLTRLMKSATFDAD